MVGIVFINIKVFTALVTVRASVSSFSSVGALFFFHASSLLGADYAGIILFWHVYSKFSTIKMSIEGQGKIRKKKMLKPKFHLKNDPLPLMV